MLSNIIVLGLMYSGFLMGGMVKQIIGHLQQSPVFYSGEEFTEELYWDFFLSDDTELIGAYDGLTMIGLIEWNKDEDRFLWSKASVNTGEIYVKEAYRGKGVSALLMNKVIERVSETCEFFWVEHGTANPQARAFWNKYFTTYQYQLVRTILPLK